MQYRALVNTAIHLQSLRKVLSTVSWSTGELSNSQKGPYSKQLVMELFRKELKRAQTRGFTGRSCPSHFILTNPMPQESICCWATCIMYVWRVLRYRWNAVPCCHKVNATFYFNWGGGERGADECCRRCQSCLIADQGYKFVHIACINSDSCGLESGNFTKAWRGKSQQRGPCKFANAVHSRTHNIRFFFWFNVCVLRPVPTSAEFLFSSCPCVFLCYSYLSVITLQHNSWLIFETISLVPVVFRIIFLSFPCVLIRNMKIAYVFLHSS